MPWASCHWTSASSFTRATCDHNLLFFVSALVLDSILFTLYTMGWYKSSPVVWQSFVGRKVVYFEEVRGLDFLLACLRGRFISLLKSRRIQVLGQRVELVVR